MFISKNVLHQATAILPVTLAMFCIGIGTGWVAPVINSLKNAKSDFSLNIKECSWIVSLHHIGRLMGSVMVALYANQVGRVSIIFFGIFSICVSWIVVIFTRSVAMLYVVRVLLGTGAGIIEVMFAIYVGENSSPNLRGIFNSILITLFSSGVLLAFTLPTYFDYNAVACVHAGISFLTLLSTVLLKEPCQTLLAKGHDKNAEKNFFWLRGRDPKTIQEFDDIKKHVLEQKSKFSFKPIMADENNRRIFAKVILVHVLMWFTGYTALGPVITLLLSSAGSHQAKELTILYGIFQLLAGFLSSFITEKFNRRALMLVASGACVMTLFSTGALYYVHENVTRVPYFVWLIFVAISAYTIVFTGILLPLSGAIRGELLPQNIKATCSSLTIIALSCTSFVSSKIFLVVVDLYGYETNFFFYSLISLSLFVYVYVYLPETRGLTLEEIQESMKKTEQRS